MRILITGKNSYIGTSFETWLKPYGDKYQVQTIDVKGEDWKQHDFSVYDVVLHVAGIAHRKETSENKELYYKVNRDLTVDVANKAKFEGVKHFIFLSSMSVYGIQSGVISKETQLNPKSNYGRSKLEAENQLRAISDSTFIVSILRPPMVYGKGCKGNFYYIDKVTNFHFIFPSVKNYRSMVHIDILCEFIRIVLENRMNGVFFPQNDEYVCTSEMVKLLSIEKGNKILMIPGFSNSIRCISKLNKYTSKVFGDLYYDKYLSFLECDYQLFSFEESIKRSINYD